MNRLYRFSSNPNRVAYRINFFPSAKKILASITLIVKNLLFNILFFSIWTNFFTKFFPHKNLSY